MRTRVSAVFVAVAVLCTGAAGQDAAPPPYADLVAKLADADAAVRVAAADQLAEIGAPAAPAVVAALADEKTRRGALDALAQMGPAARESSAALVAIVQDAKDPLRKDAVHALGTLGAGGVPGYPALEQILLDGGAAADVRVEAAAAVRRIAVQAAVPATPKPAKAGTPEGAVKAGLEWLARHQESDGRWSCADFGVRCTRPGECSGAGSAPYDPGITGLAVLAFLGAGETHRTGPHAANVRSALAWLRSVQDGEGCVGARASRHFIYNHAIGGLALAEAYGRTGCPAFRDATRNAVAFSLAARNPSMAWRYGARPDGDNDTSATLWNAKLLDAAAAAGLPADVAAMTGALKWVDSVTDETGRTGYQQRGGRSGRTTSAHPVFPSERSESLTAAALVTRLCAGRTRETDPNLAKGEALLARCAPVWDARGGGTDLYYWLHGAECLHRLGGATWTAWRKALPAALVPNQVGGKGCARGSWNPNDPWCAEGGRIWMTTACVLSLQPCTDDPAKRPGWPPALRRCAEALEKAEDDPDASVRQAAARALEGVRGAYR